MLDFIISVRSIHLFLIELAVDSQLIYYNVNLCLCDEKKNMHNIHVMSSNFTAHNEQYIQIYWKIY